MKRARAAGFLLRWTAMALAVLFLTVFFPKSRRAGGGPSRVSRLASRDVTGIVIDQVTGKPIAGASIEVVTVGFDPLRFWKLSSSLQAKGVSASDGRFAVAVRVLDTPKLTASKPGYVVSQGRLEERTDVTVPLVPRTAQHDEVQHDVLYVTYRSGREVYDIDIVDQAIVREGHLRITLEENATIIRLEARRGAVIRYEVGEEISGMANTLANGCIAPESGYEPRFEIKATDPRATCFIKTLDGRYGSVILAPRRFPADFDSPRGTVVTLPVHFNVVGRRGLCNERSGSL